MFLKTSIPLTIISGIVFAIIFLYCLLKIVSAVKKGTISYGGNSTSTSTIKKYSRKDQPFMFWAGIFAFSIPVIALAIIALAFTGLI